MSGIPLSPSNLRPFGAPPSKGRREHPREPLPLEGAAERSEAGLASFFAAKPPPLYLPHWGRGTASAVDRVLSYIAYLRRSSSLSFIPLEPYPPLRGTFTSRGRQCVGDSGILVSQPSPLGKGDRAAVDRVLSYIAYLRRSPSLSFIPPVPYPPLRGTFPSRGRLTIRGKPAVKRPLGIAHKHSRRFPVCMRRTAPVEPVEP